MPVTDGGTAFKVVDTHYKKYNMPHKAVSLNLTKDGADRICATLNEEWRAFLRNPT